MSLVPHQPMTKNPITRIASRDQFDESVADVDIVERLVERQDKVLLDLDLLNERVENLIREITSSRQMEVSLASKPVRQAA